MKMILFGTMLSLLLMSAAACSSANEEIATTEDQETDLADERNAENEEMQEQEVKAEGIGHHHELPYEWGGSYELEAGTYTLKFNQNEHGDESILLAFILEGSNISDPEHHAAHMLEEDASNLDRIEAGEEFDALHEYSFLLGLNLEGESAFTFTISEAGSYRMFAEHHVEEFGLQILAEDCSEIAVQHPVEYEGHDHSH